jgi:hypothetical protein
MGCGASHAGMAHSPVALQQHGGLAHQGLGRAFGSSRSHGGAMLEPEREVEQLVNHVNLDKESLAWFAPKAGEESVEWELCFTFDAERPGHGAVYFGCGGPLSEAGDQAELDAFLRRCETNGEISPAVRWAFQPGHEQACTESLKVQVREPHRIAQLRPCRAYVLLGRAPRALPLSTRLVDTAARVLSVHSSSSCSVRCAIGQNPR